MNASKPERAAKLREAGLTYDEVARYLGVGKSTVYRWLNPDYGDRSKATSRAWKASNRDRTHAYDRQYQQEAKVPCQCGALKGPGADMCAGCIHASAVVRRTLVEGMWADGWPCSQIAAAFGITTNRLGVLMAQMRDEGWDVPHRRTPEQVARIRAGWARARAQRVA